MVEIIGRWRDPPVLCKRDRSWVKEHLDGKGFVALPVKLPDKNGVLYRRVQKLMELGAIRYWDEIGGIELFKVNPKLFEGESE